MLWAEHLEVSLTRYEKNDLMGEGLFPKHGWAWDILDIRFLSYGDSTREMMGNLDLVLVPLFVEHLSLDAIFRGSQP